MCIFNIFNIFNLGNKYEYTPHIITGNASICDSQISAAKALGVGSIAQIEQRARHPCLGVWIKQNIRKEHPLLSFPSVAALSLRISHLLQAAQVGCYGSKCSAPSLKVRSSFQDLMYAVARGR